MTQYARGKTDRRFSRFLSVVVVGVLLVFFLAAPSHAYAFFELRDSQGNTIAGSDSSGASIDVNDLQAGIEVVFDWPTVDGNPLYGLETFTNLKDSTGKDMLARVTNEVFDEDGVYYVSLKYSLKALNPGETYTFSFVKCRNDDHTLLEKVGDITIKVGNGDAEEEPGGETGSDGSSTSDGDTPSSDEGDAPDSGDSDASGENISDPEEPFIATKPVVITPDESGGAIGGRVDDDPGASEPSGKMDNGDTSESGKAKKPSIGASDEPNNPKDKERAESAGMSAVTSSADNGADPGGTSESANASESTDTNHSTPASGGLGTSLANMGNVYKLGSGALSATEDAGSSTPALALTTTGFPYLFALLLGLLLLSGPSGLCARFVAYRRKLSARSRMRAGDD